MRSPDRCSMVSYGWANGGYIGAFFRHGVVSGLRGESVLPQGMGMEFENKTVLEGCRKGYCEYDPATGILCWVYNVLGEWYLTRLSGLMGSKAGSRSGDP